MAARRVVGMVVTGGGGGRCGERGVWWRGEYSGGVVRECGGRGLDIRLRAGENSPSGGRLLHHNGLQESPDGTARD